MLRSLGNLKDYDFHSLDGDIGKIRDFFFDDQQWTVRYMVVRTGQWLFGKDVLISPYAFTEINRNEKSIHVKLTKEQIKNSPDIDTDQPISRKKELEYHNYYGYPIYWGGPGLWGSAAYPAAMSALYQEMEKREQKEREESEEEKHLRSANEVEGYRIGALNGEVGHTEDFIAEDDTWCIRYMVVDTRKLLPGKKVIISPEWIKEIDWGESTVIVDLLTETIKNGPEIDLDEPISKKEEEDVFNYYGFPRYW